MAGGGPEWVQVTIVDVVLYEADGRAQSARCQIGLVRMSGSGDLMLASAIVGRPIVVIPPRSVVEIIGVLREGLGRM